MSSHVLFKAYFNKQLGKIIFFFILLSDVLVAVASLDLESLIKMWWWWWKREKRNVVVVVKEEEKQ